MKPLGLSAATFLAGVSKGTIVEYTLHSRTRRAMTCVYCAPKSRMTICSFIEREVLYGAVGDWREKKWMEVPSSKFQVQEKLQWPEAKQRRRRSPTIWNLEL